MTEYSGWLVSNNFLKRVCAITGHVFVGQVVIYTFVVIGVMIFT